MGTITKMALGKFIRIARGDINNYADVINQSAAISINETAEEGVFFGQPEDPPPGDVIITDAYFAKKKVEEVYEETTEEYTVVSGDNLSKIANRYDGVSYQDIMKENGLTSDVIGVDDVLSITSRKPTGERTSFEKIKSANVGEEVYVVVGHFGAVNSIQVTLKEKEALLTEGGPLTVMHNDSEVTTIQLEEPGEEKLQGAIYYAKINLRPQDDDKLKEWQEKLQGKEILAYTDGQQSIPPESYETLAIKEGWEPEYGEALKSLLSIEVEAEAEGDVNYCGKDRSSIFLNEEKGWFEITGNDCCSNEITSEQLKEIFTSASDDKINELKDAFNDAFTKFSINTCLRKAHFFAQIREEVGTGINTFAENMNYSVSALKSTFSYFSRNPDEADLYGRSEGHPADQEAIANRAYANRLGNGNIESGDGWNYRGKGYIQLTGRSNYENVNTEIQRLYPNSGVDIIENSSDILTTKGAILSAMGFWSLNGCNELADKGEEETDVDAITAVVNYYTDSYSERKEHFKKTKKVFKTDECSNQ